MLVRHRSHFFRGFHAILPVAHRLLFASPFFHATITKATTGNPMWQFMKRLWTKRQPVKIVRRRRRQRSRLKVEGLEQRVLAAGVVFSTPIATASDPTGNTYYVGSANGGIWKTTNG
jgi:hypothetical protein